MWPRDTERPVALRAPIETIGRPNGKELHPHLRIALALKSMYNDRCQRSLTIDAFRFPEDVLLIAVSAEKNLLFGLVALQNGLINQGQLVAAFQAWTLDKARGLAEHLVGCGDLDTNDRAAVEALVEQRLKKHGGDHELSLASIAAGMPSASNLQALATPISTLP